jgi:hypothetical protein
MECEKSMRKHIMQHERDTVHRKNYYDDGDDDEVTSATNAYAN